MSKHTPGPWIIDRERPEFRFVGEDTPEEIGIVGPNGYVLARVIGERADTDADGIEDARLIAAAPELLGALQQLLTISPFSDHNEIRDAKAVAREAIAKAIGTATLDTTN